MPNDYSKYNISQNIVGLKLNEEIKKHIYPRFLQIFLSSTYGKRQIIRNSTAGVQPKITLDALRNVLVPVLDLKKQEKFILAIEKAENLKKQKEAEAAALLASIDGYLLQALGITLPPPSEKKTYFLTRSSQVNSGRFDPAYFDIKFSILRQSIEEGIYKAVPVGKVCHLLSSGKTPARDDYADNKTDYPVIKVASYSGDTIDLTKTDYANNPQPYTVQKGDIFVLSAAHQAEYVGRFVKQLDENPIIKTSFVGELICLRANSSIVNPNYLFALFSSPTFQTLINCEKRGQTSHIYSNDIKHIAIPLPPPEKQSEIANHISALRTQAKQLQQQAAADTTHAKQHVERLILGVKNHDFGLQILIPF